MKASADGRRRDVSFKVGEQVLLSVRNLNLRTVGSRKLQPKWVGPYTVTELVGKVAVRLDLPASLPVHPVFHVSLVKNYNVSGSVQPPLLPETWDGLSPLLRVERLLSHRKVQPRPDLPQVLQFQVKWEGKPATEATWENATDLHGCNDLIDLYWAQNPAAEGAPKVGTHTQPVALRRSTRLAKQPVNLCAQLCVVVLPGERTQVRCVPDWLLGTKDGA
jgi:hypothetical protein